MLRTPVELWCCTVMNSNLFLLVFQVSQNYTVFCYPKLGSYVQSVWALLAICRP